MSHTNQTTNYHMSQFLGTDKPAWLTDYNTDMSTIDGQMKTNADNIVTASNLAQTAKTTADQASDDATDALADAASAQSSANTAIAGVNAVKAYLKMTQFGTPTVTSTDSSKLVVASSTIKYATNEDGSLGRLYGKIDFTGNISDSSVYIKVASTAFRPATDFSVTGFAYAIINTTDTYARYFSDIQLDFKTNGDVYIQYHPTTGLGGRIFLQSGLIFAEDFGD